MRKNYRFIMLGSVTLTGIASSLNFIGAQSYLLSQMSAISGMYANLFSMICFHLALRYHNANIFPFFRAFSIITLAYMLLLLITPALSFAPTAKALSWYIVSSFGLIYFRWVPHEMVMRHLNPAAQQPYFAYVMGAFELGAVLVAWLFLSGDIELSDLTFITVPVALFGLFLLLTGIIFLNKRNFEYELDKEDTHAEPPHSPYFKRVVWIFTAFSIVFGCFDYFSNYLRLLLLDHFFVDQAAIAYAGARLSLLASLGTIALFPLIGYVVRRHHFSPFWLLNSMVCLIGTASLVVIWNMDFTPLMLLTLLMVVLIQCFYWQADAMILSFFPHQQHNRLEERGFFCYFILPLLFLSFLFSLPKWFDIHFTFETESLIICITIVLCSVVLLYLLLITYRLLVRLFSERLWQEHKPAAILAGHALGFLKPDNLTELLTKRLDHPPCPPLQEACIKSLSQCRNKQATDRLITEFQQAKKEHMQHVVLDAANMNRHIRAKEFVIAVVRGKLQALSTQVKIHAGHVLASLCGTSAIPILLERLDDEDDRIKANILEILSMFQCRALIDEYTPYLQSDTPRIRANCLLCLSRFRDKISFYRRSLRAMLIDPKSANHRASALYVVGARKDRWFLPLLKQKLAELDYQHTDPMEIRTLAWALSRLRQEKGYDIFDQLFSSSTPTHDSDGILHFFTQLGYRLRFDMLEYLIRKHHAEPSYLEQLHNCLAHSRFDFDDELHYIQAFMKR